MPASAPSSDPSPAQASPSAAPSASPAPPPARHDGGRVFAAAAVTVLLWASAFIVVRAAGPHFEPGSLALLRMAVGTATLGLIAARSGFRWPPRRSWLPIALWGVAWFCVYNLALNAAERLIDAGTTAMLVNLAPLIVVLLGGLLLHEGFPRGLVVGAPLSFAGVVLIGTQSSRGTAHLDGWGVVLALIAALAYAGCALSQKVLLRTVDAATMTFVGAAAGTIALVPWLPRLLADATHAPATATLGVVYLGIFPTGIAFTTWAYVLTRLSAGHTSATTYVVPALTILLSWFVLGEAPTLVTLFGGALCLLGVALTRVTWGRTAAPGGGRP